MKQPISILPAIALRGTTILPDMIVHFDVSRERSMKAIEAAMLQDEKIFLVTQKDPEMETPGITDLSGYSAESTGPDNGEISTVPGGAPQGFVLVLSGAKRHPGSRKTGEKTTVQPALYTGSEITPVSRELPQKPDQFRGLSCTDRRTRSDEFCYGTGPGLPDPGTS